MTNWIKAVAVFMVCLYLGGGSLLMAEEERASIAVNHIEELSESSLPGFIKVRYQRPGVYWEDYYLHLPVSAIEQVNVEPRVTKLYLKSLKLPDIADEGPVELTIPNTVRSSSDLFRLLRQALRSRNDASETFAGSVKILTHD
ncbi:MAG: hypothetical protein AAF571_11175 [Verrucomicrobiota bacterium]